MSYEGFQTTQKGRALISKLLAEKTLHITKVMAGSGKVSSAEEADTLENLISPTIHGTSSEPDCVNSTMTMTLQFRSDLSISDDLWVQEYGIFAQDPDLGEILMYYGALGDSPQQLPGNMAKYSGVLDFHVAIAIGEDFDDITLGYPASAFLTKEELIAHNQDESAHENLMFPRLQLHASDTEPTQDGVFFWLDDLPETEDTIKFQFENGVIV